MELKTILNKTIDTVKLILAQPTMIFRNKVGATIIARHVVREDDVVRPDLIALFYYSDQTKLDLILKFNGISDPFSLNPGETLLIPDGMTPYYKLERPMSYEENIVKKQFMDTKRLSKKDQARLEARKKKYNKENLLPPNVIPVGKKNYEFDGGEVRLGAQAQTDAVVDSITADLIASANADTINTTNAGADEVIITDTVISETVNSNDLSDKQAEDNLNNNSGVTGATETTNEKTDTADSTGTNTNDGTGPAGSGNSTGAGSGDDAPCNK